MRGVGKVNLEKAWKVLLFSRLFVILARMNGISYGAINLEFKKYTTTNILKSTLNWTISGIIMRFVITQVRVSENYYCEEYRNKFVAFGL